MHNNNRVRMDARIKLLVLLTAAFSVLIISFGFVLLFVNYASRQNRQNIEYVMQGITRQLNEKVNFLESSILAFRYNDSLNAYMLGDGFDKERIESQLALSMDLYSDRNRNDSSEPFIVRAYLFNKNHRPISIHYYPETISAIEAGDEFFSKVEEDFYESKNWYSVYSGMQEGTIILTVKIFDENMENIGICAVELNQESVANAFEPLENYAKAEWQVGYIPLNDEEHPVSLSCYGMSEGLCSEIEESVRDEERFYDNTKNKIAKMNKYSFGIYSVMMISRSNIFYNLGVPAVSLIILVTFSLGILGFYIVRLTRQVYQKELLAVKTEVKYLQSQLNPHFQYNVLAMLSIKAKQSGDEDLYQSLRAYSKLIRGKIFREKEVYVTLEEELSLVEFYLQIQKERYGDSLTYQVDYDTATLAQCMIPKLIIQPLVENAVEHGIEPKEGPGHVLVRVTMDGDKLHILIQDDGVGIGTGKTQPHTGTSLANTKQLLKVLYPNRHQLQMESQEGKGTQITIKIPVMYD